VFPLDDRAAEQAVAAWGTFRERAQSQLVAMRAAIGVTSARAGREREQVERDRELRERDRLERRRARVARRLRASEAAELWGGMRRLEDEMERARSNGKPLAVAVIDVDPPEEDSQGDDGLLHRIADDLKYHIRGYDLIFRLEADELVCALPVSADEAQGRLSDLEAELPDPSARRRVSVGLSELRDGDSVDDFMRRADHDLMARES
jgi:GGDEF domain-containing protein